MTYLVSHTHYNLAKLLTIVPMLILAGCASSGEKAANAPVVPSPSSAVVSCSDPTCLLPQFLACAKSELKMPFMGNATYTITVLGLQDDNCGYTLSVVSADGTPVPGTNRQCLVPKNIITSDTFGHFFGEDGAPGKEGVKAEQDRIQATYCK